MMATDVIIIYIDKICYLNNSNNILLSRNYFQRKQSQIIIGVTLKYKWDRPSFRLLPE